MFDTRNRIFRSCAILAALAGSPLALAQEAATPANAAAPAVTPATAQDAPVTGTVRIFVKGVVGKARFRTSATAPLQELKPGQELLPGAEIFTVTSSIVQLQIGSGQVFTIDRLGRVIILETGVVNGKETTTLQMPYGRVKFEITSTQVANDVHIQAPDATLAVKGTIGIMEVIPGQPTAAWGGDLNTGIFNVMYTGGLNTDVGKNHKTKKDQPSTAGTEDEETYVETSDPHTRDPNGRQSARWTPSLGRFDRGFFNQANHQFFKWPDPKVPDDKPVINESFFFDLNDNFATDIHQHDLDGFSEAIGTALSSFPGDPAGAAVLYDKDGFSIVGMNSGYQATALGTVQLPYGTVTFSQWHPGTHAWQVLGTLAPVDSDDEKVSGGNFFDGLGALNDVLYASGYSHSGRAGNTGNVGVFALTMPSTPGGAMHADQRMSFPSLESTGGLTGANDRGTMFMTGQFAFHSQLGAGGLVLLELDPRINYIQNAWSVAAGDFITTTGTTLRGNGDIGTDFVDTGVAYANHQVVIAGTVGKGEAAEVHFDPNPVIETLPHVTVNRYGPNAVRSHALAGEGGRNTLGSVTLQPAEREVVGAYAGIDPLWRDTSYSRDAAQSRTFQRMVTMTILDATGNPQVTPAFYNSVRNAIADHYGQVNGVGQALQQFNNSQPPGSPFRLP